MPADWRRELSRRKAAGRAAEILEQLPAGPGRLLDFGCGNAALTRALAAALPRMEVTGLDVHDAPGLHDAPDNLAYRRYDGVAIPFPAGHFDAALAAATLHHVASVGGALREMARVTRVGGVIVILDDSFRSPLRRLALHAEHVLRNRLLGIATGPLNFQSEAQWQEQIRGLPVETRAEHWVRPFSYLLAKRLFCLVRTPDRD